MLRKLVSKIIMSYIILYICSIYIYYYIFGWQGPLDCRGVLLGWGGVGHVLTFMWTCTWSRCYTVALWLSVAVGCGMYSWVRGGVGWSGIIVSLALSHMRHATLLYVVLDFHTYVMLRYCTWSWTSTRTSCYATVRCLGLPRVRHATLLDVVLDFHTYVMLRSWTLSWTSTHMSCYAMFSWTSTHALS